MARARVPLAYAFAAVLVASAWVRIEETSVRLSDLAPLILLGAIPGLALAFAPRRALVLPALAVAVLLACDAAFDVSILDARPRDGSRDFFGPVLSGIENGVYDFYETRLPFNRVDFPNMHALLLLAVFGFVAALGLLLAARRPIAASFVLLLAVAWPLTLVQGERPILAGTLVLIAILAFFFVLRPGGRRRGLAQAAGLGFALVLLAGLAASTSAVAKDGFISWQGWDFYDRPQEPVSVSYVWNSNYDGIEFPKKKTTVLKVEVSGPRRTLYWRATTLDRYTGLGWREELELGSAGPAEEIDGALENPLLPKQAKLEKNWIKQDVTVGALRDNHLIASAQPMRWQPGTSQPVRDAGGDVVQLTESLRPGQRYTAWSYAPRPKPKQLGRAALGYSTRLARYFELLPGTSVPSFSALDRDAQMETLFGEGNRDPFAAFSRPELFGPHAALYRVARRVTEGAETPYAAAVALEVWFRRGSDFVYDEQPPPTANDLPPLVNFVLNTKRGYCQHYAGAMALMLRLLGVPARVAAGFTSGAYDAEKSEWTVTDHDAHTWVEVYFPGWGWLPFDPTPNRGTLSGTYTYASIAFNADQLIRDFPGDASLLRNLEGILPERADQNKGSPPGSRGAGEGSGGSGFDQSDGGSLIGFIVLVLLGAGALLALVKQARRATRFLARDPRALAAAYRRDVVGFLADQRLELPSSLTLAELGTVLEEEFILDAKPFVSTLAHARFGPPGEAAEAIRRARRELRRLRRQMQSQLGLTRRLRGVLSLRSLTV